MHIVTLKIVTSDSYQKELSALMNDSNESNSSHIVNKLVSLFYSVVESSLNKFAFEKTKLFRKPPAPWVTPEFRKQLHIRDQTYNKDKRTNNLELMTIYKNILRELKQENHRRASNINMPGFFAFSDTLFNVFLQCLYKYKYFSIAMEKKLSDTVKQNFKATISYGYTAHSKFVSHLQGF